MKTRASTFRNMTVTLLAVTLLSSVSLGVVYIFTRDAIASNQSRRVNEALRSVLPRFDNRPAAASFTRPVDGGELVFYPATLDGQPVGTAVHTFSRGGYSGQIDLLVGFRTDGTIHAVEVLAHKETPGLGDLIETGKSDFHVQFKGQHPETFRLAVRKEGGDVEALTAATISSRAYAEAIQKAFDALQREGIVP